MENPKIDTLLRSAMAHYEFEAIHPFADGNGRLGRVLISLSLMKEGVLEYPLLYMSGFLLREKKAYYRLLLGVTTSEDWISWLKFFLQGIKEQALKSRNILEKIYSLYRQDVVIVEKEIKTTYAVQLVEKIFMFPVITALKAYKLFPSGPRHSTAMANLRKMEKLGLLRAETEKTRNIPFYNEKLISLLEEA